ncbi:rhodanese-like domain-containing protein [Rivularia sp. UHCC 0363]|uniref:rhodanese-like domain-containing protein n=1 Tax=Rivularia sp. UHCC 0363 TaxID=3110244 RepID=UPI003A598CF8
MWSLRISDRLSELNPEQKIWGYCQVGQRSYSATHVLRLNGFNAYTLSSGFKPYQAVSSLA